MTDITSGGAEFRNDSRSRRFLPANILKKLYEVNDLKGALSVAETLGILTVCIIVATLWWSPWTVLPAIFIIATRQQACFVLAHDATHYRLFRSRLLNDIIGRFVGIIVGISMCSYRVVHRLHHNHLYEDRDPDIPLHGGYPRGKGYLMKKLAKDLMGLNAHKTFAYFFGNPAINDDVQDPNRPLNDTSPALRLAARRDRWFVVGFHILAPVAAFASGFGVEYLVLWVLPLVTLLQPILRLRAICEHGAVSDLSSPLLAARTNIGPKLLIWLLFPHSVNYHIEHHLYPAIPHYNLAACHHALQELNLLDDAEVMPINRTFRKIFASAHS